MKDIYSSKTKVVKFVPFDESFAKFRNKVCKLSGISKENIIKESNDCYLIFNEIIGFSDGCMILTNNPDVPESSRLKIINIILFLEFFE
jgi:hypothetical protein